MFSDDSVEMGPLEDEDDNKDEDEDEDEDEGRDVEMDGRSEGGSGEDSMEENTRMWRLDLSLVSDIYLIAE